MSTSNETQTKVSKFFGNAMPKYVVYAIWAIAFFTMLNFFRGCSTNKEDNANRKSVELNTASVDSLNTTVQEKLITKDELLLLIEIEGLIISKRMLYDNNAIIRTTVRPDDRMNEYDADIKKLQKKLGELKNE